MKVLEGLKKIKHLDRKIEKNRSRIRAWCSHLDNVEPQYDLEKLLQSTSDMILKRDHIRHMLHSTNINTTVEWRTKTYTVDELIMLRTVTLPAQISTLKLLRRHEKDRYEVNDFPEARVVTHFDPKIRDKEIDKHELHLEELDTLLDQLNITTDLQ